MILRLCGLALLLLFLSLSFFLVNDAIRNFQLSGSWAPVATLLAVVVALWNPIWQQRNINDRAEQERWRRSRAARALLPLALVELTQYADECAALLMSHYPQDPEVPTQTQENLTAPAVPTTVIRVMQECILHAIPLDMERLAATITHLQIQNSRLSQFQNQANRLATRHTFDSALTDVIQLHAQLSSLFNYARGATDTIIDDPSRLFNNSAQLLHISRTEFPSVFELMRQLDMLQ